MCKRADPNARLFKKNISLVFVAHIFFPEQAHFYIQENENISWAGCENERCCVKMGGVGRKGGENADGCGGNAPEHENDGNKKQKQKAEIT